MIAPLVGQTEKTMASLHVRGLDDDLVARLKERAKAHNRSAEAEHREILRNALLPASKRMPYGDLRGKIWVAPDFDETPEDIIDIMENGPI